MLCCFTVFHLNGRISFLQYYLLKKLVHLIFGMLVNMKERKRIRLLIMLDVIRVAQSGMHIYLRSPLRVL